MIPIPNTFNWWLMVAQKNKNIPIARGWSYNKWWCYVKSILQLIIKDFFGPSEKTQFSVDDDRREDIPQVSWGKWGFNNKLVFDWKVGIPYLIGEKRMDGMGWLKGFWMSLVFLWREKDMGGCVDAWDESYSCHTFHPHMTSTHPSSPTGSGAGRIYTRR